MVAPGADGASPYAVTVAVQSGSYAGTQTFTWNGENQAGVQQTNGGTYSLTVNAQDASGAAIPVSTAIQGTATAVQQLNGQTLVTVGGVQVPLSSVTSVD